jgi:predicted flap endonuclease-1-like 5' DNA nuclease
MMKRRLWTVMVVAMLLALFLPTNAVLADDGGNGGRVVFGDDFVLRSGDSLYGDLAVFGGDVTLEAESTVDGDMLVMGGSVAANGEIDGDVVVFGGNVDLGETAVVDGDLITVGGAVSGAEQAVRGRISEGFSLPALPRILAPSTPGRWRSWPGSGNVVLSWFLGGLRAFATALVLALLALVVVSLWPKQTKLLANTIWEAPAASVGMGFLTYLVVAGLLVLLIITICLSPLLALATAVSFLLGWIALGWLVGRRLLIALKAKDVAPIWEASLGVLLLTLLGAIPCIGWLVWVVGGAFGLGAVALTRFGTRRYNGTSSEAHPVPPSGEPVLPEGPKVGDVAADHLDLPQVEHDVGEVVVESPVLETPKPEVAPGDDAEGDLGPEPWDDLELIHGIGPVFAARLREKGITTFAKLAASEPEALATIVDLFPERVREDDWIGQAKRLLQ